MPPVTWQLPLILLVLNVLFWYFAIFWRHEAFELRSRLSVLEAELSMCRISAAQEAAARELDESRSSDDEDECATAACVSSDAAAACPPCGPCAPQQACPLASSPDFELSSLVDELTEGGLCPANISDVEVWLKARDSLSYLPRGGQDRGELYPNGSYAHFDTLAGPMGAQWFCDKIKTTLEPWIEPKGTLDVSEVIVGAFSGPNLHYTRAVATRGTWMTQFPNSYIYDITTELTLPIIGLGERYNLTLGTATYSEVQPLQMFAVRDMYLRHPQGKWFYVVGDDVYAIANTMVRMLQDYDADQLLWLVQYPGEYDVPAGFNATAWPDRLPIVDEKQRFLWQTGSSGWFISRAVARLWSAHVERFVYDKALNPNCNCPDVYSGFLLTLLGIEPTLLPGNWGGSMSGASETSHGSPLVNVAEPIMWHYQHPRRLIAADQWFEHRKIDRIVNLIAAGAKSNNIRQARYGVKLLVRSYRAFADAKFDVMRRWQATIARLAAKITSIRTYDLPMDGRVLFTHDEDWHVANETQP